METELFFFSRINRTNNTAPEHKSKMPEPESYDINTLFLVIDPN